MYEVIRKLYSESINIDEKNLEFELMEELNVSLHDPIYFILSSRESGLYDGLESSINN